MFNRDKWLDKVNKIFSIYPRIGLEGNKLWIPREKESFLLNEKFSRLGGHICLDGPTGSGKTSFIWTYMEINKINYMQIQITQELDWKGFCHLLVNGKENSETGTSSDTEIGIDKGLPTFKWRISLGSKGRESDSYEYILKVAETWTEHDVARMLSKNDATLILDDIEMANEKMIKRLADLCRLLSQTYLSKNAKIVFIGKDAVYYNLYKLNTSLEGRLFQISLGGFPTFGTSVSLIRRGLTLLGLHNPWRPDVSGINTRVKYCEQKIWEAADGSPKLLNELGNDIASQKEEKTSVQWREIVNASDKMLQEKWIQHSNGFSIIIKYIEENPIAEEIVKYIYKKGIYNILLKKDIVKEIQEKNNKISDKETSEQIDGLCQVGFCVQTGGKKEIIFLKDPTEAHYLGVAVLNPEKFKEYGTLGERRHNFYNIEDIASSDTASQESELFIDNEES
jgi:hypothetical protein